MQIGLKYEGNGHATFWMSSSGSSSASLNDLQDCDYKALFSTVLGRTPAMTFDQPALTYGIHFHTSQQIRAYYELDKVNLLFKKLKTEPFQFSSLVELRKQILLDDIQKEPLPLEGKRTTSTLFKLIEDYEEWSREHDKDFGWLMFENHEGELEPCIEQPFALPFTNDEGQPSITFDRPLKMPFLINGKFEEHEVTSVDIIYQGVFDTIRSFYGTPYIGDYKTSSENDPDYFIWREFSNQFIGYVNAGRTSAPVLYTPEGVKIEKPIVGMMCDKLTFDEFRQSESYTLLKRRIEMVAKRREKAINGAASAKDIEKLQEYEKEVEDLKAQVAKEGEKVITFKFERRPMTELYSTDHIDYWKNGIITKIQNFLENHARSVYPQNRSACKSKWGMCPYFRVCISEPSTHMSRIMGPEFKNKEFKI